MGAKPTISIRAMARSLGRHALGIGAAGAILAGLGGSAAAKVCADRAEHESLTVRTLQTEFMVAALSCDARHDYNSFVVRFKPVLASHGSTMTRYFSRNYGKRSAQVLNAYVTDLANQASALSVADRPTYCRVSRAAMADLLSAPPHKLHESLVQVAMQRGAPRDVLPACDTLTRR